ncbi:hypothetical protein SDJN02_04447, partial [Cucurbita argyrosperma subsp. argyrosperma]
MPVLNWGDFGLVRSAVYKSLLYYLPRGTYIVPVVIVPTKEGEERSRSNEALRRITKQERSVIQSYVKTKSALKELDLLKEDATVYKLVGHILVKQDLSWPNENVRMRTGYLADE